LGGTAVVPPLITRIRAERRLLHAEFGSEYEAYLARTWRLLPGLLQPSRYYENAAVLAGTVGTDGSQVWLDF
jgi:hypothetical protein